MNACQTLTSGDLNRQKRNGTRRLTLRKNDKVQFSRALLCNPEYNHPGSSTNLGILRGRVNAVSAGKKFPIQVYWEDGASNSYVPEELLLVPSDWDEETNCI